jgi:methionyl-tRNA formyltransferase
MKRSLSAVFMGTSRFATPILQSLYDHYGLIAVVTQPDRPRGRGRLLSMPEIKQRALELGVPVHQPERVRDAAFIDKIRGMSPELIVVAAYGQILPGSLLSVPPMGCINVHGSLLPKYRGAAPIHWALAQGESETGVTTMLMDERMDTGPVFLRRVVPIHPEDTAGSLQERLAVAGAALVIETIEGLKRGDLHPTPQDAREATYAPPFKKKDGWVTWSEPARTLHNRIRAVNPWPGAFTRLRGKMLKIFWAEVDEKTGESQPPGCVVEAGAEGIRVATGKGHIILKDVQLEGKRRLPVQEFLLGYRVEAGTMLGDGP